MHVLENQVCAGHQSSDLLILDGGCGLELKARKAAGLAVAYDTTLFSTAALRDTPDAIEELHRDWIRAGCNVITTASYAVTEHYLGKVGQGGRVEELAARSVALARAARHAEGAEGHVFIAASVPPLCESYHAVAEEYDTQQLREQYATLLRGLRGCDIYLCETMASIADATLAVGACRAAAGGGGARVWLSFNPRRATPREAGAAADGQSVVPRAVLTADGATVRAAVEVAVALGAEAVLFNCATPELIRLAVAEASAVAAGRIRVGGYANFWEEFEAAGWKIELNESTSGSGDQNAGGMVVRTDLNDDEYASKACEWVSCGASIVGGCCGIGPKTMAVVARRTVDGL